MASKINDSTTLTHNIMLCLVKVVSKTSDSIIISVKGGINRTHIHTIHSVGITRR